MIYPVVPFPVTLSEPQTRFEGHGKIFMPIDALSVLCAQLTRDLFAIAKFLFYSHYIATTALSCIISEIKR